MPDGSFHCQPCLPPALKEPWPRRATPFVGAVRVYAASACGATDPYLWACTLHRDPLNPDVIELKAFRGLPGPGARLAIYAALGEQGFVRILWFRGKDERPHGISLHRWTPEVNRCVAIPRALDASGMTADSEQEDPCL